jgi:hypothetical protein
MPEGSAERGGAMKDFYLKISAQDRMRMERIVLDRDGEDAVSLVRQSLEIVASTERGGMQSHLDRTLPGTR